MLKTSQKDLITQEVIKNLLSAHERIADSGCVDEIIHFTKFILKLADKRYDALVNVLPEDEQ